MVVVVDNFGFGSGFCGFWLWVSWFMDVVVAVAVGCSCDGWLSWLVVVVLFYCFFFFFFCLFIFLCCVVVTSRGVVVAVGCGVCFFIILLCCLCYFIVLKTKIKPLMLGVL